jgi:transglutaminase-like putative cysteine protease
VGNSGGWLYAAGTLLSADQNYVAEWRRTPQSDTGDQQAANTASALADLRSGADLAATGVEAWPYSALSLVGAPSQEQLRLAGGGAGESAPGDYPDWVRTGYLALPASTPQRVRDLAQQLAAGQLTAYDKAAALQAYLRGFPYSLDVPAPPAGRDVADYFLFDLQRGYCDYYATALAVLGRAVGLPTRLVMGYASGSYDAGSNSYQVTEADAHSWTEIYFPGYGWVEFEPTASRPAPAFPKRMTEPGALTQLPVLQAQDDLNRAAWLRRGFYLLVLAVLAGLASVWAWRRRAERDLPDDLAIRGRFVRLARRSRPLRPGAKPGDTPLQISSELAGQLQRLAKRPALRTLLGDAGEDAAAMAELYCRAAYAQQPADGEQRLRAGQLWGRLGWRVWLARLSAWLKS